MSMITCERMRNVLGGKIPDRVPICEVSFWPKTIERWKKEGLPENQDPITYFQMDRITNLRYDTSFRIERKIIEDTEEYTIFSDEFAKIMKEWKPCSSNYGVPQHISYLLTDRNSWERVKDRLSPEESRIPKEIKENYKIAKERGDFISLTIEEPAWFILDRTFGFENGLVLLLSEQDIALEIIETNTNFNLEMAKLILEKGIKPDAIWLWSDLCYKNGMLFSPEIYKKLIYPYHRRIKNFCEKYGLFLIYHCDGYVREFIPLLIDVGVDAIQPLEARCGNDVRVYKKIFGDKITFFGNIPAEILSSDKEKIKEEITSKIKIAMEGGRYIFHSDHSVPPTVSLENYKYAIELAKKIGKY